MKQHLRVRQVRPGAARVKPMPLYKTSVNSATGSSWWLDRLVGVDASRMEQWVVRTRDVVLLDTIDCGL